MASKVGLSGVQVMAVLAVLFLLSGSTMAAGLCKGKDSWPELVGRNGSTAEAIIKAQNPYVKEVVLVPEGNSVILNFDCKRVWVWVKPNGTIYLVPKLG